MTADFLRLAGHAVSTVSSGPEALKRLNERDIDVVLCDIGLPGMDGFELARAIRAAERSRRVRPVALTGYGHDEAKARIREAGFDDYLSKPAGLAEIEAVLIRLLPREP